MATGTNAYRRRRLKQYITGWINYFRLADMKTLLNNVDE